MTRSTRKGKFKPKNPQKYKGNSSEIIYRSGWELQCMIYFDRTEAILEWASEECVVNYISPLDGKSHRYYIDFYAKVKRSDGIIENLLIEVKPFKQTQPPKTPQKKTRRYLEEKATYDKNTAKWSAARAVADKLGWKFVILTENELGLNKHK